MKKTSYCNYTTSCIESPQFNGHQLPLLHREPLIFESTKGGLLARCGYSGEPFGGIYSQGEAAWLQQHFKDRTCPIAPVEFGAAAELAVRGGAA